MTDPKPGRLRIDSDNRKLVLQPERSFLTVYFDGSCPLCRAEIGIYRTQDRAGAIRFLDVSQSEDVIEPGLTRQQAMQRFHVRRGDGTVLSGAPAFVAVWGTLRRWRWLARLAALPGVLALLEVAYRWFLPVRPSLQTAFGHLQRLWTREGDFNS